MGRGPGMIDRFERLRHDPILCRDNNYDNISYVSATCAHCRECRVAGCIDESKSRAVVIDGVSPNVLRDSARFTSGYTRLANRIQ